MAVEVKYSKRLHRHAVPVVVAVGLLMVVSIIAIGNHKISTETAGRALVARPLRVTPTPNGLSKITASQPRAADFTGEPSIGQAGRTASLLLSLEARRD